MGAISGQPSPKPQSLDAPVPGASAKTEFDDLLSQFDVPSVPSPAAEGEDLLAQFDTAAPSAPPEDMSNFPVQEQSSFMGVNTDIAQEIKDAPIRILANLAQNPESIRLTLEKKLGKDNVRAKGSDFFFRRPGEKAFRKLDPDSFEVVNDLFSDFYREYLQGMAGVAGAAEGAAAGAAATGPLAPLGAAGGAFVGGTLGVAAATPAIDLAARGMGVVPAGEKGIVGKTGEYLAEGLLFATGEKIAAGVASKIAARRAATQGIRKLEEIAPVEKLQEGVKQNLQTLRDLENIGYVKNIEGTNISVPAHQLIPFDPQVELAAKSVANQPAFQQAQKEAAENFGTTALDLVETAAELTRGRLSQTVKGGVPLRPEVTSAEVTNLFNGVRRAEGEVLGEFRKVAKATAKKTPLPAARTAQVVQDIFKQIGVTVDKRVGKEGVLRFPPDDDLIQIVGSKDLVAGFKGDLQRLNNKLTKGGFTIDELLNESSFMGAKNETARRVGGIYKSAIGRVSSAIRADSRDAMPLVLSPEDAIAYNAKMDRFRSISNSMEQLDGFLRDDIGMNTFARGLVNKGKEGLANLRAAKEFLLQEDPKMYDNLIGQYFEELALKHRDTKKLAMYNAKAMKKEIQSLGAEYLDELFPARGPINKGLVLRSFDLSEQLESTLMKGTDKEVVDQAKQALSTLSWFNRGLNATHALMRFGSRDNRLLKILSREGVESFLTQVPKKNKPQMRETLSTILTIARRNGTLASVGNGEPAYTPGAAQGSDY